MDILQTRMAPEDVAHILAGAGALAEVRPNPPEAVAEGGAAAWVEPQDEAQVADVLRVCAERRWTVIPVGAGTQLGAGHVGPAPDVWLSLSRMNRLLDHAPGDLVVTVQPGLTLAALQAHLADARQMLPLDPPVDDTATLGGILATGVSGPRRALYGTLRDMTIALRVVYPDGRVIKTGAKVVKNVAGYDMTKLFVGSCGTLAVITEATFKLRPLPLHRETVFLTGDLGQIQALRRRIVGSNLIPSRLEILGGAFRAPLVPSPGAWTLAVDCDENRASAEAQTRQLLAWAKELSLQTEVAAGEAADAAWAQYRDEIREGELCLRFQAKPSALAELAERLQRFAGSRGWVSRVSAGAISGVGRWSVSGGDAPGYAQAIREGRALCAEQGGALVVERAAAEVRTLVNPFGASPAHPLMEQVKRTIDPNGVLSPGRFVGGI
ncbi:FAD-binding oxidoreductase [Alicyclobacillus sp.]|uniref:FAD-binding oxidoreductase n=1 Tax=Alicyclobacillus sp. TaxID=61169 RepID=UPI0025C46A42|nr:FAD-binding oxidoreductase [Alicyclobacillus sp.]MCL6517637.1 FAD-binding oxidoreductase [Alicyclobacillus sp.]